MEDTTIWLRRVDEWRASGLTSEKYCEGKSFTAGGLRNWAFKLGKVKKRAPRPTVRLARVLRSPPRPAEEWRPGASSCTSEGAMLFLECGRVRMAIRPGFDRVTLATVLELLDARGER
ncbi:MAG: hypothetical protein HY901_32820 [Deltaproteobacteria bacterium]|nr:hypothetical protein [Deltaproteobacteria bacterium]